MAKLKKLTDDQVTQLEALAVFLTQEQIADYFGISRRTLNYMRERDERIDAAYAKGKAKGVEKVASALFSSAISGVTAAQIFYLKTQAGWREKSELDLTSSDGSMTPRDSGNAILEAISRKYDSE